MKYALSAVLVICASLAQADSPIDCVDPDIANTLLQVPGYRAPTISTSIPADTNMPDVPDSFALIGSSDLQNMVLVAYRVNSSPDTALAEFQAAPGSGWRLRDTSYSQFYSGFRLRGMRTPNRTLSLCHGNFGNAQVTAREADTSGSYVTVATYPRHSEGQSCDDDPELARYFSDRPKIPLLLLPADASILRQNGGGGGNDAMSTSAVFETRSPMASTLASLNDQMLEQGWKSEGGWSGQSTLGSTWVGPDDSAYGVLSITAVGEGAFQAVFNSMRIHEQAEAGSTVSNSAIGIIQSN